MTGVYGFLVSVGWSMYWTIDFKCPLPPTLAYLELDLKHNTFVVSTEIGNGEISRSYQKKLIEKLNRILYNLYYQDILNSVQVGVTLKRLHKLNK